MSTAARRTILTLFAAAVIAGAAHTSYAQVGLGPGCDDKTGGPSINAVADKTVVRSGESVTLTASGPTDGMAVAFMWRADTGRIFGTGSTVRFDTTGLSPGRYDVVLMGRSDKCGVSRIVTTIEVQGCPELRLTADSLSVTAGQSVELSATGYAANTVYQWTASTGSISGSGNTVRLETRGLPSGPIAVRVNATDADCQAEQSLTINVTKLEPLPPSTLLFNTNDSRLDNTDKAQLDDTSLRAQQDPNARILVVGASKAGARSGLAKRRAERTRDYLVNEKGIDPARVEIRFKDNADQDSVQVVIVPAGADMPSED